jgi:hypothetical protein
MHATFFRSEEDVYLIMGTLEYPPSHEGGIGWYEARGMKVIRGKDSVQRQIESMLERRRSIAIRDYYPYWAFHHESAQTGKLMFVDRSNSNAPQHIFFDDNVISTGPNGIVDVRDLHTFEAIPIEQSINRWVVQAKPYRAIVQENYFLDEVRLCVEQASK